MKLKALVLACAMAVAPAALAQPAPTPPAPRETVAEIATTIRDLYFSAERGDAIADALEAEAAAGRYDELTDPRDLAAALTARLRPEDAHFNVGYDPNALEPQRRPPGGGRPDTPQPRGDPERLSNYGFRAVQILPGNIGLIDMGHFANIDFSDPRDPARRAADAALALVANADAVIFDVRNNGGGAPSMVGYLSSAFTPAGANIYNAFHNREGVTHEAPEVFYPTPRLDVPLYILTSGRTGSAAEAFPYTLQAAGRATIVGEATGGAANPGGFVPITGGYRVFVSGGSPINPITGRNWEGTGVIPDVPVAWDEALTRARVLALGRIDSEPARWALAALTASPPAMSLSDYAGTYGPVTITVEGRGLASRRDRRPPVMLAPLEADLFYVVDNPTLRFAFERDASGRVIAYEMRPVFGAGPRERRTD